MRNEIELQEAYVHLKALRSNLPDAVVLEQHWVTAFHALVEMLANLAGADLRGFVVPDSAIVLSSSLMYDNRLVAAKMDAPLESFEIRNVDPKPEKESILTDCNAQVPILGDKSAGTSPCKIAPSSRPPGPHLSGDLRNRPEAITHASRDSASATEQVGLFRVTADAMAHCPLQEDLARLQLSCHATRTSRCVAASRRLPEWLFGQP